MPKINPFDCCQVSYGNDPMIEDMADSILDRIMGQALDTADRLGMGSRDQKRLLQTVSNKLSVLALLDPVGN